MAIKFGGNFMTYNKIHNLKQDASFDILKKDETKVYHFNGCDINSDALHRLFITCEDVMLPLIKNESGAELLYMLIDDSLDSENSERNRYCLDFSCRNPLSFTKRCLKKIIWQPLEYGLYNYDNFTDYSSEWSFGISAKANELKIEKGGFLRFRLDIWKLKAGTNPHDTTAFPDETYTINIPEGTYSYNVFSESICIKNDDTACVIATLEGENYSGNVYFEAPFVADSAERNVLPEFETANIGLEKFAWLGQNLSKKEWPHIEIKINGNICFDGEIFLKIHRFSPFEIDLPQNILKNDENILQITYKSNYRETVPIVLNEIKLLEKDYKDFNLLRCPHEAISGKDVNLLFEIKSPKVKLEVESDDFILKEKTSFSDFGLMVLSLTPIKNKSNMKFTVKSQNKKTTYVIERFLKKVDDNVIIGSGDMIYINISDIQSVCNYIKWYVANDIGNFITIRPVYRWGGQRTVNAYVWCLFRNICEKLDIKYVHISDGRDIPGLDANPSDCMLSGKNFMGRQLHERDGQLFYWAASNGHPREINAPLEEFFDLAVRLGRENPKNIEGAYRPFNIEWSDFGYSYKRKFCKTTDIVEIHNIVSDELKDLSNDGFTRHTGPSVMYKYFYQCGFKWTGAETMDGATEILLSFLRGASNAYGVNKYGAHLALQWSTFPHDNVKRYRRYLLSLFIPYMHGVTDINTEEGLWFMEALYTWHNRLSEACEGHRLMLQHFNKYVRTHSRSGEFFTPIAFLHGKMDGWNGFLVHNIWGMPFMKPGDESNSWIHLKSFYPLDKLDENATEVTGYVAPNRDKPLGTFTGTPRGCVDCIPVECGNFNKYLLLIFAGYNYAQMDELDRISQYIKDGGVLICTWAHFTDTTNKNDIDSYNLNIVSHDLTNAMSDNAPEFVSDTISGNEVMLCSNVSAGAHIVQYSDNGTPLVCTYDYGKGKIILLNTIYYPGHKAVFGIYENLIHIYSDLVLKNQECTIECDVDIQYTMFKQDDGSMHYYFTAVDWYNENDKLRTAVFNTADGSYLLKLPFGKLLKLVYKDKYLIWSENEFAEVIKINRNSFIAQGYGMEKFYVAKNNSICEYIVDFSKDATVETELRLS